MNHKCVYSISCVYWLVYFDYFRLLKNNVSVVGVNAPWPILLYYFTWTYNIYYYVPVNLKYVSYLPLQNNCYSAEKKLLLLLFIVSQPWFNPFVNCKVAVQYSTKVSIVNNSRLVVNVCCVLYCFCTQTIQISTVLLHQMFKYYWK